MSENRITLFGIFEKHAAKNTTTFTSWCEFVAWSKKAKPNLAVLNEIKVLSPEAYADSLPKKKVVEQPPPKSERGKRNQEANAGSVPKTTARTVIKEKEG